MTGGLRRALPLAAFARPRAALACSVCFSASEQARWAYYGTTALLILVPVLAMGAIGWWLRRAARRMEREQSALPGSGNG